MAPQYKGSIEMEALGRIQELGDMYDARSETFCGTSILRKMPEKPVLHELDNHNSSGQTVVNDTLSSRLDALDVSASLRMSLMSDRIKINGSAKFIRNENTSNKVGRCTFIYKIFTVVQKLQISDERFQSYLQYNSLKGSTATHVVVGVYYGANAALTLSSQEDSSRDKLEVGGSLQASFNFSAIKIDGKVSIDYDKDKVNTFKNFNFTIEADLLPKGTLPANLDEALQFIADVPALVREANGGKGVPKAYILIPMSTLCEYLNVGDIKADALLKSIDEDIINNYIAFFEDLAEYKCQLNDVQELFKKKISCIEQRRIDDITKYIADIKMNEQKFKGDLGTLLIEVRSGSRPISSLEAELEKYKTDLLSFKNIQMYLNSLYPLKEKLKFLELLEEKQVQLVAKNSSLAVVRLKNGAVDQYLLFTSDEAEANDPELHLQTLQLFFNTMKLKKKEEEDAKSEEKAVFIYVDMGLSENCGESYNTTTLCHYRDGAYICEDMKRQDDLDKNSNFAQCTVEKKFSGKDKNAKVVLELRCPNLGLCKRRIMKWRCTNCKEFLLYDFKNDFHCECGMAPANDFKFKCSDPGHGVEFKPFASKEMMSELLSDLRTSKELNILLLGQTGVGKSMWINGMVNYLSCATLEDAEQAGVVPVVPARFTVTDENFEQQVVEVGGPGEDSVPATPRPASYTFTFGETTVRFVDTPGFGHSEGVLQDRDNFNRVIDCLSRLYEIHGICILLKPDENRVGELFDYAIEEILAGLPKTVASNIAFVVTHSAETMYKPGDTTLLVENILRERKIEGVVVSQLTTFCVDNEPFRYLCSLSYPNVKTSRAKRETLAKSWKESREQTQRLLKHFRQDVSPHAVKDIVDLNDARNFVFHLRRPLAEVLAKNQKAKSALPPHLAKMKAYYRTNSLNPENKGFVRYVDYLIAKDGVQAAKLAAEKKLLVDGSNDLDQGSKTSGSGVVVETTWEDVLKSADTYRGPLERHIDKTFHASRQSDTYNDCPVAKNMAGDRAQAMQQLTNSFRGMFSAIE